MIPLIHPFVETCARETMQSWPFFRKVYATSCLKWHIRKGLGFFMIKRNNTIFIWNELHSFVVVKCRSSLFWEDCQP